MAESKSSLEKGIKAEKQKHGCQSPHASPPTSGGSPLATVKERTWHLPAPDEFDIAGLKVVSDTIHAGSAAAPAKAVLSTPAHMPPAPKACVTSSKSQSPPLPSAGHGQATLNAIPITWRFSLPSQARYKPSLPPVATDGLGADDGYLTPHYQSRPPFHPKAQGYSYNYFNEEARAATAPPTENPKAKK